MNINGFDFPAYGEWVNYRAAHSLPFERKDYLAEIAIFRAYTGGAA